MQTETYSMFGKKIELQFYRETNTHPIIRVRMVKVNYMTILQF